MSGGAVAIALGLGAAWLWSFRWLQDGREQIGLHSYRAAEKSLSAFLAWHPTHAEGHFLLGGVYGELRNWELALREFRQVPVTVSIGEQARWRIGDVSMMLNRAADTEAALRETLEHWPNSLEARRGLIALYRWQDREFDAQPLVWEAFELTPVEDRAFLLAEWFRFRFAQHPPADTLRRLRAFLAAQPDDMQSAIALALWNVRQHQLEPARVLLERVFTEFPQNIDARAAWATCLLELGEWDRAHEVLDEWPADQRDLRYWKLHGIELQDYARDYPGAIDSLGRWIEAFPDDWQIHFRLSTCLRHAGRIAEADREAARTEQLKQIVKYEVVDEILNVAFKFLNRPEQLHRMGEFYRSIGYEREAKAWFELALAQNPQFQPSRSALTDRPN